MSPTYKGLVCPKCGESVQVFLPREVEWDVRLLPTLYPCTPAQVARQLDKLDIPKRYRRAGKRGQLRCRIITVSEAGRVLDALLDVPRKPNRPRRGRKGPA